MKLLEDRIEKDGYILGTNIIKVDSFLNHQLDIKFLSELGEEIYNHFKDRGINKILTIEASGIALATVVSEKFGYLPVVFAKKQKTKNIGGDLYESKVQSFTTDKEYTVTVSKKFLNEDDKLLLIDDFLAEGNALKGLVSIAEQSGAKVEGISVAVEKGFQEGGQIIRDAGHDLLSLAIIESIDNGEFTFRK
ncbi:xanthine phosphoribosyltransferase [Peptoniphilus asaccharolyticus DSM 20463]|uniref:Xanthine phosphoribosyltransferase n=1 Tax=Peptoniphilus asaccharolyticus DSM 20463 TaxID=573058 RepID=A0A1W1VLG3_PEPAS|nr:xanthine phosphoribosyltransferase [Peptoniphilus asaccharolyticus]MBL7574514.1 xanthine phosphoribosyltransferase [Peptoniphilus asaccharolyticus]SMB94229.1 xanthine phosphoribosyltransferase [Peptoniphilus asaccharolyticus DSM 20463]